MLTPAREADFFYWINERHQIYLRKAAGEPRPWTVDPVLRDWKFTNVFRQLDVGTQWLTEHFIRPHWDDNPALMVGNLSWYRMFNWRGTGALLGWRRTWRPAQIVRLLSRAHAEGKQVFTGAHIVWGGGGRSKIEGVTEICHNLWRQRRNVVTMAGYTNRLEDVFNLLCEIRGVGGFMAYEIVSDLRHTPLLLSAIDVNTWANVGPGAMRGLRRLDPYIPRRWALGMMIELLQRSREPGILGPHVPPLELRDIEHVLCEFDKYCRVRFGEGRPRSTYPGAA